jgi:hypothetical protein
MSPVRPATVLLLLMISVAGPALGRIGGGESYSDSDSGSDSDTDSSDSSDSHDYSNRSSDDDSRSSSSYRNESSSSSSSAPGDDLITSFFAMLLEMTIERPAVGIPLDLLLLSGVVVLLGRGSGKRRTRVLSVTSTTASVEPARPRLDAIVRLDPNFSEAVFTDFCYSLYARVHTARGQKDLNRYALYLSPGARDSLSRLHGGEVTGIVIGGFRVTSVHGLEDQVIEVVAEYEANYTQSHEDGLHRWYVREEWVFHRDRDVLSPTPENARAEHCPRCGAALQTRSDGACAYCGAAISSGAFDWYVRSIDVRERVEKPPSLISNAPERGTDSPTRFGHMFAENWRALQHRHTDFEPGEFERRVRMIAHELQNAWTSRDWERARAFETDALFHMHRYWIDEYKRQGLKNIVDDFVISRIEPVKVVSDAFFDAITVRIHASGRDYTTDEAGNIKSGSATESRVWTEYWTFIRGRGVVHTATTTAVCPNCSAPLKVSQTGVCAHCGGKVTSGEYDWILSRIEQDEAYGG